MEVDRGTILRSSRKYYAHRAYYYDLLSQRLSEDKRTSRELAFLEFVFKKKAARPIRRVLDVACGGGRHIVGLAEKGYDCVGRDLTQERVEITRRRAARQKVSIKLERGDATRLEYDAEFDAVLALDVLFLLPNDKDVRMCVDSAYRALRPGGVFICDIFNALATGTETRRLTQNERIVTESTARGIRITTIETLKNYDPVLGVGWIHSTSIVETPDGRHVFRDRERFRFFTYWDILHFLSGSGFKTPQAYVDWKTKAGANPKADQIVFVARK